ncbi:MAG: caspase family protein [Rectinemataceae bacterium]|nr:caspase family protein [Rectinemataceae bacterium]
MKNKAFSISYWLVILLLLLFLSSCSQSTNIISERRALLIGISEYASTINNLDYPVIDAEEFQDELDKQFWGTSLLKNDAATKQGIKAAIESHFKDIPKDGTALIYYSGHGTLSNLGAAVYQDTYGTLSTYSGDIGEAVLVPYDFDNSSKWTGGISSEELYSWISQLNTENVIVILDSCFSGGFIESSDSYDTIAAEFATNQTNTSYVSSIAAYVNFSELILKNAEKNQKLSPITISASGSKESSFEDYPINDPRYLGYTNGIFTFFLLESITKGDSNNDGFVTCTEAYTYAARALNKIWNREVPSAKYYPHISGGLRDLVLFTR